jgi:hypothetical protein
MKANILEATIGISRKVNLGNYEMKEIFFSAKIDLSNIPRRRRDKLIQGAFEQVEVEVDERVEDLKPTKPTYSRSTEPAP